ncbi:MULTISPECIES: H-NS family nucleoid-associated regulatory protein [Burkholderia]|uniref:H-NS histone family protein n=1 Tax=Burkholderia TaxID=32008 RepID=UPI0005B69F78|nr:MULTISPECIES: H-NS histone family protein [Burkholderia]KIP17117.1 H-NS histone family protein [Burkholderia sp. MSHR3999]
MSIDRLQELLTRRAQLDVEIATYRAERRKEIVEQINRLIREYKITPRELELFFSSDEGSRAPRRRRVEPLYWDPQTGATWSGRGKRPRWMNGRDPEEFRLKPVDGSHEPEIDSGEKQNNQ